MCWKSSSVPSASSALEYVDALAHVESDAAHLQPGSTLVVELECLCFPFYFFVLCVSIGLRASEFSILVVQACLGFAFIAAFMEQSQSVWQYRSATVLAFRCSRGNERATECCSNSFSGYAYPHPRCNGRDLHVLGQWLVLLTACRWFLDQLESHVQADRTSTLHIFLKVLLIYEAAWSHTI